MNKIESPVDLSEKADELRARSVWLMAYVAFFSWFFFAILYWALEIEPSGTICRAECFAYALVTLLFRKSNNYLLIGNLLMAISAVGFCIVACSSPVHRGVIHYTPILILVASQLFGKREAFYWLLISLSTMVVYLGTLHSFEFAGNLVELAIFLGVPSCVFFCCYQAEVHYELKTSKLVDFSKKLQKTSQDLKVLATTDSLTGLHNRYQFQNELDSRVNESGDQNPFALLLIDMDGFKEINDTMGHSVGDDVLVEIGARLSRHCGSDAVLGRLGGDEFCVIYDRVSTNSETKDIASQLHEVLTAKYLIGQNEFSLGASVGIAFYPLNGNCPKRLLAFADTAMYHAKHNKLPISCYTAAMTERILENRSLNDRLASAIEKNEFRLVYQPQFDIWTGEVTGAEALLRWCPDGEMIGPDKFIPILEQSGLMIEVSKWVIQEACQQQVRWRNEGFDIPIAINISAIQFDDPDFIPSVLISIERFGVEPKQIDLEITEGLLINNVSLVASKLNQIRDFGIQISVDDFGTGYSSLAYLRHFPIDKLKIDRTFVKDIPERDDGAIASSIILLGQVLGMKVLAEGVETEAQLEYLKAHNCSEVQGYLFAKPESPDRIFEKYHLQARGSGVSSRV